MSSTSACGFFSLNDMLGKAESSNLNVTQLVQDCPDICTLLWGNGNPDLSGIGANIAYIIQVAFVLIFGPIFVAVYGLRNSWKLQAKVVQNLETLHDTFVDGNAQFSIPVAVATVVRIKQAAPLYEITFLQSLTTMQLLGLLCAIVASGVVHPRKRPRRIVLLTLYGLMDFAFYMGLIGYLRTSKQSWTSIKELGTACEGYGHIVPGFVYAHATNFPHITAAEAFKPTGKKYWIIFGLVLAGFFGLVVAAGLLGLLAAILASKNPLLLGPMSLGLAVGTLYCLVQMEAKRSTMKKLTGGEFRDNEWGFGQVIALFLWAPLLIQMIYYFAARLFADATPPLPPPERKDVESLVRKSDEKGSDTKVKPKEDATPIETLETGHDEVDPNTNDEQGLPSVGTSEKKEHESAPS